MSLQVVECACMVELKALGGYDKLRAKHPDVKVFVACSLNLECALSMLIVLAVSRFSYLGLGPD